MKPRWITLGFVLIFGCCLFLTTGASAVGERSNVLDETYFHARYDYPHLQGRVFLGKLGDRLHLETAPTFSCDTCSIRACFYLTKNGKIETGFRLHERGLKELDDMAMRLIGGGFVLRLNSGVDLLRDIPSKYDTLTIYDPFEQLRFGNTKLEPYITRNPSLIEE